MAKVMVIMGSKSDLSSLKGAFDTLSQFGISFSARILSAHRTPDEAATLAKNAEKDGIKVFLCAAGMSAHLAGVIAAHTILPVIGIPMPSAVFSGFDALMSMVQMPPGIPVATVTSGAPGAKNAALLAIEILALSDSELAERLHDYRRMQTEKVLNDDKELQSSSLFSPDGVS